jgi:hypothetical protein
MCILASVTGLITRGMPIDILARNGFVLLVSLTAENAILVVEFARQKEDEGSDGVDARSLRRAHTPASDPDFCFPRNPAPSGSEIARVVPDSEDHPGNRRFACRNDHARDRNNQAISLRRPLQLLLPMRREQVHLQREEKG